MKPEQTEKLPQDSQERDWLAKIAAGRDRQAMKCFYLSYRARLGAFLFRILRRQSLVDEVYNDVMLVVWRKAGQYNGSAKVSTWLFSIAYRSSLKRLDKEKRFQGDPLVEQAAKTRFETHAEHQQLVQKALDALSAEQRTVIELAYFIGNNYAEIAEITATPENTVKTRMFYARKKLLNALATLGVISAVS